MIVAQLKRLFSNPQLLQRGTSQQKLGNSESTVNKEPMGNTCSAERPRNGSVSEGQSSAKKASLSPPSSSSSGKGENLLSISASFKFFDLKEDGVLDREELLNYFKSDTLVAGIIERLDKNRDGVISYSEFYSEVSKIKDGEATLQKYLEKFPLQTEAVVAKPAANSKTLRLQNRDVPLSWGDHIPLSQVELALKAGPFVDWVSAINLIENPDMDKPELVVDKVHIQYIDMFGPRVGFIKFEVAARKWNEKSKQIAFAPGIVFMRGGAVGILCILTEAETGHEYSLITIQPRIPAGYSDFAEIPAGMLDGELNKKKFAGKAAKEMTEETLLEIKASELFDLTAMAYGDKYRGMYPSAGGCDEFLKLYLYRRYMSKAALDLLRTAHTGDGPSEVIKLKLVPLEDLWREAPDAKALSALYLYHKFIELKIDHPPTPLNLENEQQLAEMIQPKILEKEASKGKLKASEDRAVVQEAVASIRESNEANHNENSPLIEQQEPKADS